MLHRLAAITLVLAIAGCIERAPAHCSGTLFEADLEHELPLDHEVDLAREHGDICIPGVTMACEVGGQSVVAHWTGFWTGPRTVFFDARSGAVLAVKNESDAVTEQCNGGRWRGDRRMFACDQQLRLAMMELPPDRGLGCAHWEEEPACDTCFHSASAP